MSDYELTWITDSLAVGYAPTSYDALDAIKVQGIDAIVNLCAEFSDLHEIEAGAGFEVYYLPIWDEDIPEMQDMEKALAWLDEAIYLGKKVLVHCRHGIGRTGTFITSYMIRRGMGLKAAKKKIKMLPGKSFKLLSVETVKTVWKKIRYFENQRSLPGNEKRSGFKPFFFRL